MPTDPDDTLTALPLCDEADRLVSEATPGPWAVAKKTWDYTEIALVVGPDGVAVLQEPADFFASLSHSWVETGGLEADLALAAAAPRLLRELSAALRVEHDRARAEERARIVAYVQRHMDGLYKQPGDADTRDALDIAIGTCHSLIDDVEAGAHLTTEPR